MKKNNQAKKPVAKQGQPKKRGTVKFTPKAAKDLIDRSKTKKLRRDNITTLVARRDPTKKAAAEWGRVARKIESELGLVAPGASIQVFNGLPK